MPKRPPHHRVKVHAVYSVAEAAETLGVHRQTVIRWIRRNGLAANVTQKPWLIRGADLKPWLATRRFKARTKLGPGQIYCLPCRASKRPALNAVDYRPRTESSGILVGLCPDCERLIHRIVRKVDVARVAGNLEVAYT